MNTDHIEQQNQRGRFASLKTWAKLIPFLRPYRGKMLALVVMMLAGAACDIAYPLLSGYAVDTFVTPHTSQGVFGFAVLYLSVVLIQMVGTIFLARLGLKVEMYLGRDLKKKLFVHLQSLSFSYYNTTPVGTIMARVMSDTNKIGSVFAWSLVDIFWSAAYVIGSMAVMLSINWIMTLVALVMVPVSMALVAVVVRLSQKHFVAQQRLLGALNGRVEETFSGHAVVRAFGREDETVRAYEADNEALYNAGWKAQFLSGLMMPVLGFVGNLGYVAVAVTGAFFAVAGTITVGDIQAFVQYVKNFTQPITQLAQISNVLQSLAAAAERIFAFLDLPEVPKEASAVDPAALSTDVEFDGVRFGYTPDVPVIRNFSARVAAGQTVAIVGPTGAGKTTMVKLLMRFYDVDAGAIRIGGADIRELSRPDVRNLFAMVLQDTWLFSGTVRENIRYGRLNATDGDVEAAAREACADHFIRMLPGGYDFEINEDASNLSQGQRQLITIARALLADRRMLILDEATSSVDTRTELRIQEAMDRLMAGRTSFVIAHRLSTIRAADLILVMRDGDIVEQGSHEELLAAGGFYAELYNSQFASCNDRFEE